MSVATNSGPAPRIDRRDSRIVVWMCMAMLVAIITGGAGFIYKLIQFSHEAIEAENEASFALVPVAVYICVAIGFVLLFVWALLKGQFKNVEEPKYRLLEEEERYDRAES